LNKKLGNLGTHHFYHRTSDYFGLAREIFVGGVDGAQDFLLVAR
jgi:hypothetical protein